MARTFVYVSCSQSEEILVFRLDAGMEVMRDAFRVKTGGAVMPLAVSPDRRFLYAFIRSRPYSLISYAIDSDAGGLELLSVVPVPESLAAIATDRSGRFLLGASYGGDIITVNPIGGEGFFQPDPVELIRPGRNPHFIQTDPSNRFAFVPNLGSDHICQFVFDAATGRLASNRPAVVPAPAGSGPRHLCFSPNNRFVYVLTELSGEVICYTLDAAAGILSEKRRVSIMPPDSPLPPGTYTPPANARVPGADPKIWAADIHITPDGNFLYASERTTSILACFSVDAATGTLTYSGSVETEKQPRSFSICPRGDFLAVAGEKSNQVSVYAIDRESGALALVCRIQAGSNPNWVEIVEFR